MTIKPFGVNEEYREYLKIATSPVPYDIFHKIITTANKQIIDAAMEGYKIKIPGLGSIKVLIGVRRKPQPDWGKSRKLKAEIEARGGTPYKKGDAEDGEKYLVFYTDKNYVYLNLNSTTRDTYDSELYRYKFEFAHHAKRQVSAYVKSEGIELYIHGSSTNHTV